MEKKRKKGQLLSSFQHDLLVRSVKLLNVIFMTMAFALCWYTSYSQEMYLATFFRRGNWVVVALFFLLYYNFGRTYDAFQISMNHLPEMVYSQGLAAGLADVVMVIVIWLLLRHFPNPVPMILLLAGQVLIAFAWSILSQKWYFSFFSSKKTMIIYDMRQGMEDLISDYGLEKKFRIRRTLQVRDLLKKGVQVLDGYDAVFLCGIHSKHRNIILKYCIANNISVFVIPRIGDVIMSGAKSVHMLHLPVLRAERYRPAPEYTFLKRFMDVLLSGIAIVILSPVMLLVSFMVRRDGGPAFYRQVRLTKDGKEFEVLKFRSMRVDAEKDGVARLSSGDNDDRITPVGRVIRKVRLDELPQLFNIFKGDMSIVGPRPERPEIAKEYEKELPEFALRLQAKAGLTGLAQVYGKYNTTPYDKLMMDLMYIAHPSLIEDLRICFATVKILFLPESTEGVAVGATTAMDYENAADSTENDTETVAK